MELPKLFQSPPRWIPRQAMPQVDEADLTALLEWLAFRGVDVAETVIPAKELQFRQRINWRLVHSMPADVYAKPILISEDGFILDGNHRAAAHRLNGDPCNALRVERPFTEAVALLFSFAGTYDYAIGNVPIRN